LWVGDCGDRLEATLLLGLPASFACQPIIVIVALESFKVRNSRDMDESNFDFTLPTMDASHRGTFRSRRWDIHDVVEKSEVERSTNRTLYLLFSSPPRTYKGYFPIDRLRSERVVHVTCCSWNSW